jgi:chromosome segregation ATPase
MTHTLLKGTRREIERELAEIDAQISELRMQRDTYQKCFEYEKDSNIRLETEIKRLRESLMDIGGTFHAVEGITMAVNAALHPLPNDSYQTAGDDAQA